MRLMNCIRSAARQAIRRVSASGDGFTLIELIVVIAILGILIAIAIPTIRGFLESSREQAYEADRRIIQLAVDAYYYSPGNERVNNVRQYPIVGKRHSNEGKPSWDTNARLYLDRCDGDDADDPIDLIEYEERFDEQLPPPHPVLGTRGGTPNWREGTGANRDNVRNNPAQDRGLLYCPPVDEPDGDSESGDGDSEDQADHWLADVVSTQGTECNPDIETGCIVISSRDYIIDFCELVRGRYIEDIPESASNDHDRECGGGPSSTDTVESTPIQDRGSYTWYVDSNGKVQSLYFFLPTEDSSGYANAYP